MYMYMCLVDCPQQDDLQSCVESLALSILFSVLASGGEAPSVTI